MHPHKRRHRQKNTQHPPRTLVLIGFMGTGKSTIGRKLHQQLGYQLIDTDQLIEKRAKKSIRVVPANVLVECGQGLCIQPRKQLR